MIMNACLVRKYSYAPAQRRRTTMVLDGQRMGDVRDWVLVGFFVTCSSSAEKRFIRPAKQDEMGLWRAGCGQGAGRFGRLRANFWVIDIFAMTLGWHMPPSESINQSKERIAKANTKPNIDRQSLYILIVIIHPPIVSTTPSQP